MAGHPALAAQTGVASLRAFSERAGGGISQNLRAERRFDAPALPGSKAAHETKARATATEFETVFLNTMFSQMFAGSDGEGPLGGGGSGGVWRSFLTEEYAKVFAKAGGIGIADHVYRALIAQQEASVR